MDEETFLPVKFGHLERNVDLDKEVHKKYTRNSRKSVGNMELSCREMICFSSPGFSLEWQIFHDMEKTEKITEIEYKTEKTENHRKISKEIIVFRFLKVKFIMPTLLISALSDIAFLKKTLRKIPENSENNNHKKLPKIMEITEFDVNN